MKSYSGRVGNVAEEDAVHRRIGGLEDPRHKCRAKRLALAVDVGVVRAREINPLKRTRARKRIFRTFDGRRPTARLHVGCRMSVVQIAECHFPFRRDDESFARRKLLHGFGRHVERRLYGGAFRGDDNDIVVDVMPAWPDAVRVARRKRPPVGSHAAERPRAVGICKRR